MEAISAPHPAEPGVYFDGEQPAGASHVSKDSASVQGDERAYIDHAGVNAQALQSVRRGDGLRHHGRPGHDGPVPTRPPKGRRIEGNDVLNVGHLTLPLAITGQPTRRLINGWY